MSNLKKSRGKIIGLVGGIGSGKSVVARQFYKLGCAIIDADSIAHFFLKSKSVKDIIVKRFGRRVLKEGRIDHCALSKLAFASQKNLRALTDIVHPLVKKKIEEKVKKFQNDGKIIVLDVPLLYETGMHKNCDFIIYIRTPKSLRINRLSRNRGVEKSDLERRESFQFSLQKKISIADFIIDNSSNLKKTQKQVTEIFNIIKN